MQKDLNIRNPMKMNDVGVRVCVSVLCAIRFTKVNIGIDAQ